ncbi:MAG: PH domain-containing protein [Opitutaceae bacterium]
MVDEAEKQLWSGTYSTKAMAGAWVISAIIFAACSFASMATGNWRVILAVSLLSALPGLWCVAVAIYRHATIRYTLTTRRLVCEAGLLTATIDRVELLMVEDVRCKQSGLDRAFGIGSIIVQSNDRSDPTWTLAGIEGVRSVTAILDQAVTEARNRHGVMVQGGSSTPAAAG